MSMLQKIFGKIRKANAEAAQQRLAVRSEVITMIVSEVTGLSSLTEANEGQAILQAIADGIVSEQEANQVYELATKGFGYIKTGEQPFINSEPLIAAHAALVARHRDEMRESLTAMREAESRTIEIGTARQQFQRLAIDHPEVCEELCRQVPLSWSPRFTDEPRKPTPAKANKVAPQNHEDQQP